MKADKQTLKDLGIFIAEEGGISLFDYINKTTTTGGKYRLRDIFQNPPEGMQALMIQQETIRYLAENSADIRLPFNDYQMKSLEAYLSTNIEIIRNTGFLASVWFFLTDIQAFRYLKNSVSEMISFIEYYSRFLDNLKNPLPEKLSKVHTELQRLIEDNNYLTVKDIINRKHNFYLKHILVADKIIRTLLKPGIEKALSSYYTTDALLSLAKSTKEYGFQFPEFNTDDHPLFIAEGIFHPLLQNAVATDVLLNRDSNFIFLTEPNMSGKTTFLKAVGISVFFAHLGMGVPALRLRLSYFDTLLTSLNISDSIFTGYSFFYSEVKRIRQLAEALNNRERVFSIFDELFRGTNIKDAYDASVLIISGLALWRNSLFILSSHLWELWSEIRKHSNIKDFHFEAAFVQNKPVFTYRLLSGVSNIRMGMYIIENENIHNLLKENHYDKN